MSGGLAALGFIVFVAGTLTLLARAWWPLLVAGVSLSLGLTAIVIVLLAHTLVRGEPR